MRLAPLFAFSAALALTGFAAAPPARALDCTAEAEDGLRQLSLPEDAIAEVDYVQKLNPSSKGPTVLGVRAWVRLKSCSGYLVIDMTRSCFIRQRYTRGDCRVEGVTPY